MLQLDKAASKVGGSQWQFCDAAPFQCFALGRGTGGRDTTSHLPAAMTLAKSKQASNLPGFIGGGSEALEKEDASASASAIASTVVPTDSKSSRGKWTILLLVPERSFNYCNCADEDTKGHPRARRDVYPRLLSQQSRASCDGGFNGSGIFNFIQSTRNLLYLFQIYESTECVGNDLYLSNLQFRVLGRETRRLAKFSVRESSGVRSSNSVLYAPSLWIG